MSFLRKFFRLGGSQASSAPVIEAIEHEGFMIVPVPVAENGQFRLCAMISKQVDGEARQHKLIRADMFSSSDEAAEAAIGKAKQVIKEQGERIFG